MSAAPPDSALAELSFPFCERHVVVEGNPLDEGVFSAIRELGTYEAKLMGLAAQVIRPHSICIDVGANIGALTLAMAELAPDGVVLALEPEQSNAEFLLRNVERNNAHCVKVRRIAAGSSAGSLTMHTNERHPGGGFIATTDARDQSMVQVPVATIDELVAEEGFGRVDLLKLDVEGSEIDVIAGALQTLRCHKPVLFVECNPIALWRFRHIVAADLLTDLAAIYGHVGHAESNGEVTPIYGPGHLDALLARHGIVDLVAGMPTVTSFRQRVRWEIIGRLPLRWSRLLRRLRKAVRRGSEIPEHFVGVPKGRLVVTDRSVTTVAGSAVSLTARVVNDSSRWWSSDSADHPVRLSYRSEDGDVGEGVRSDLCAPVPPGGRSAHGMVIIAPREAGAHRMIVSLVQEGYCWFDDVNPSFRAVVEIQVVANTS